MLDYNVALVLRHFEKYLLYANAMLPSSYGYYAYMVPTFR